MGPEKEILYFPISISFGGIVMEKGLFAPKDYPTKSGGLLVKVAFHPSEGQKLPEEAKPVSLRVNGAIMLEGIMATPDFFAGVKTLKEAGKISFLRQSDGRLMIAEKCRM